MENITIRLERNYNYPDYARQTPGGKGVWNRLKIVDDFNTDLLIVINQPKKEIYGECSFGGKILLIQEPPYDRNNYLKAQFKSYDLVFTAFHENKYANVLNLPALLPWHVNIDYDQASRLSVTDLNKDKQLVCITSNSLVNPGHKPRLDFIARLKGNVEFDLYGRGFQAIEDKFLMMSQYRYALCIENYSAANYWTEKIVDAYLSWNMPIYYGCPNITDYFHEKSLIQIDINQYEESLEKIQSAISGDAWQKGLKHIEDARKLILNEYQFFPYIERFINEKQIDFTKSSRYLINDFGYPKSNFFKRFKYGKRF